MTADKTQSLKPTWSINLFPTLIWLSRPTRQNCHFDFGCTGGMERLQKFWLAGVCRKNSDRKGDRSLPLEILNFTSAFILLAGGMVFVVLLLICEHIYFKFLRVNLRKWDHGGCCSLVSLVRSSRAVILNETERPKQRQKFWN